MPTRTRRSKGAAATSKGGKTAFDEAFGERWTNFAVIASFVLLTAVMLANVPLNSFYQGLLLLAVIILFIGIALRLTKKQ